MSIAGSSTLTTSGTSQIVSPKKNGIRIAIVITNYGTTRAWINLSDDQEAAVGTGIPLDAGMSYVDSNSEQYYAWQGSISAVDNGAGGATTLSIWERVSV